MDGTILIAEDDSSVRKVLSQALTRAGCRVHATSLLATLARWVFEGKGDLVITDVAMPDGDGIEQIRQLRNARPELPIIVISAQNTIATALKAEESAAFAYLPKPFDVPSLLSQVKLALNRRPKAGCAETCPGDRRQASPSRANAGYAVLVSDPCEGHQDRSVNSSGG